MPAMRSVRTAAPGTIKVAEIQRPAPGPRDLLVRVRACGICGTDAAFVQMGGMPGGGPRACLPEMAAPASRKETLRCHPRISPRPARSTRHEVTARSLSSSQRQPQRCRWRPAP